MIDIHSHIIPAVDDGSEKIETSLSILKSAVSEGVTGIFATSHFITGRYENSFDSILSGTKMLNVLAKNEGLNIEIYPGQEVYLSKNSDEYYREGLINGLNGTSYMLVEFGLDRDTHKALDIIYELKLLGVKPILAHPERYINLMDKSMHINDFIKEGCLFQINAASIAGKYGKDVQRKVKILVENGIPDFVAGDTHTKNYLLNSENLNELKKIDRDVIENAIANSYKLLNGEAISYNGNTISTKNKFFNFFSK